MGTVVAAAGMVDVMARLNNRWTRTLVYLVTIALVMWSGSLRAVFAAAFAYILGCMDTLPDVKPAPPKRVHRYEAHESNGGDWFVYDLRTEEAASWGMDEDEAIALALRWNERENARG